MSRNPTPTLVRRLEQLWWAEAGRNNVLPMGNWMARALPDAAMAMSPPARSPVGRKVFRPGAGPIADEAVPMLAFGGRIEVDVDVPDDGGQGVRAHRAIGPAAGHSLCWMVRLPFS